MSRSRQKIDKRVDKRLLEDQDQQRDDRAESRKKAQDADVPVALLPFFERRGRSIEFVPPLSAAMQGDHGFLR